MEKTNKIAKEEVVEKGVYKLKVIRTIRDYIKEKLEEIRAKKLRLKKRIKEAAKDLAEVFEHSELREAIDTNKYQVIGFIVEMYENPKELLEHKKELLDLACIYSRKKREPIVYSMVPEIILKNYVKTPVELDGPVEFDNFPGIKFSEIVFLAQKYLEDALHFIEGYKYTLDGYPTRVRMGLCNLSLLGRSRHNRFIVLVRDAPGTDQIINTAYIDAKKVDIEVKNDQRTLINQLKAEKGLLDDQIDESYQKAEQYKSAYIVRTKDIQAERKHNLEEEFKQRLKEKQLGKKRDINIDWTAIIIIFAVISVVLFIVWFFFTNFPVNNQLINDPPTSAAILKLMFRGRI